MKGSSFPLIWDSSMIECEDTALRLNSYSTVDVAPKPYEGESCKRKWNCVGEVFDSKNEISLDLDLGCSGSSNRASLETLVDISRNINLNLGRKRPCNDIKVNWTGIEERENERPKVDLELSLSTVVAESDLTSVSIDQLVDEGSTSSKWKRGGLIPLVDNVNFPSLAAEKQRNTRIKTCQFTGCQKGARGASGRCISHGGGRRCQRPGCQKGAEGKTVFCKAHGGGQRCEHFGCTKSAEGRTNLCIAHGGGKRCNYPGGCARAARGKSNFCIRHGGGKRCKVENCTKSAEGLSGLCIGHGGGRRCEHPNCTKGAQGSTKLCKAHGGGRRCAFIGCTKGAEGCTLFCKGHGGGKRCTYQGGGVCTKSVHGGTMYCVSHGGGKRCSAVGCTKSARGKTAFCVRHGGGKRCKFEGCGKSAQGSTDFCKAHGGGKRCLWGQLGFGLCDDSTVDPCNKFARGKTGLCTGHAAQVQDKRVHGNGTVVVDMKETPSNTLTQHANVVAGEGTSSHFNGFTFEGCESNLMPMHLESNTSGESSYLVSLPEGRVHGGALMAKSSYLASLPQGRVHGGALMAMLRRS